MSRTNVYHVALEPIESRYSAQWLNCINKEFKKYVGNRAIMIDVLGDEEAANPTEGGFLDFCKTNKWKSSQIIKIARLFEKGYITPGSVFLFTDAWNPGILNVRYMSDLMGIPVRIVSYWHAGSYDVHDVLGYKIKDRTWSLAAERSFFHASDVNVFATEFHKNFFIKNCIGYHDGQMLDILEKCLVSGQPHYEILKWFDGKSIPSWDDKKDWIIFPHRNAPEKQPWLFEQLADMFPEYEFIMTSGLNLSKDEYYKMLLQSKIMVSMAQHEMLGISMMEGVLANVIPIVPNRLSYTEMYRTPYLYPDTNDVTVIANHIKMVMNNPNTFIKELHNQKEGLKKNYLTCTPLWDAIIGDV